MFVSPALVVGLGNPGAPYADTRHNAGFWFLAALANNRTTAFNAKNAMHGDIALTDSCRLLRPNTHVNHSGRAVSAAARYFKIPPAAILVAHDEVDLPAGTARLKYGGGEAGHNGLADVSQALGSRDYWRLRLGVGKPAASDILANYVLRRPPLAEREAIDAVISQILSVWSAVMTGDYESAMLQLHTRIT